MSQLENVRLRVPMYIGRIKIAAAKALGLAILLENAAPSDLSPTSRKRLKVLKVEGQTVETARSSKNRLSVTNVQPLRNQFAAGWSGVDLALESVEQIPAQQSDEGERARTMRMRLFPGGREFMKLSALEAWTHAQSLFRQIDEEELEEELTDLIGPRFLKGAKLVTNELGDILGLGETPRRIPSATAVADAMDSYTTALSAYARSLAADLDEKDEASCKRFFDALAPIDMYRSTQTGDGGEDETDPAIVTPVVAGPMPSPMPQPEPLPSPFVNE